MTSRERTGEVVKAYFGKNWNEVNEPSGTFLYDLIANAIDAAVAEAVAAERDDSARLLYETSIARKAESALAVKVNEALLYQIEAETFRWAAQFVENPNRDAIRARGAK